MKRALVLLPDIERGPTWKPNFKHRCLVRQLLRFRAQGNRTAVEAMKRGSGYSALLQDANAQWAKGNRGERGDWR